MQLSALDVQELKKAGYSESEIQKAMKEIEMEELQNSYNQVQYRQNIDPRQNSQISAFSTRMDENLIRWQLELNDILERAEHILKGDVPLFKDGHIIWEKNPNPEKNTLNEYGVQEVLKILSLYVNRNTILSDYTNREINFKVFDFGREINNLIFMRSEEFGMNTEEKRKNYPILIREMVDIVHSSYKRALDGGERRSLREMIQVTQATSTNAQLGGGVVVNNAGQPRRERGLLNPLRYVQGKYL